MGTAPRCVWESHARSAESHLELLRLKGDTLEATGLAPASARVQDATFDAQGVLWMIDEAGTMCASVPPREV